MSSDAAIPKLAGLSGANLIAVEHAELVVALYTAVTALDENGLHQELGAVRDSNTSYPLAVRTLQPSRDIFELSHGSPHNVKLTTARDQTPRNWPSRTI
jgi:hypothetical protein